MVGTKVHGELTHCYLVLMMFWASPAAGMRSTMLQVSLKHSHGPFASPSQGGEPTLTTLEGTLGVRVTGANTWSPLTAEARYSHVQL